MSVRRLLLVAEPGKDGVFEHVADLIVHLGLYHEEVIVDLAYSSCRAGPRLGEVVNSVRARGGEAVDLRITNAPGVRDLAAAGKIRDLARRTRPSLVHAHSSKAGALCRILALVNRDFPPVIYTPHAYFGLGRSSGPATLLFNTVERVLAGVGRSINVSYDERIFGLRTLKAAPRRLVLINNGIDVMRFRPGSAEEKRACREDLSLPQDRTLIVTVGRHSYQKNFPPLYRALNRLQDEPAANFFFAHAGAGADELGQTLSPDARAHFRRYEHLAGVEKLFRAADAFILTSRYEGLALSVLQALATGLRVFATEVPGNRALARIGFDEIGWIPFSDDPEMLAGHIEASLRPWLGNPAPPSPRQRWIAERSISARVQFEKICRLYERIAR